MFKKIKKAFKLEADITNKQAYFWLGLMIVGIFLSSVFIFWHQSLRLDEAQSLYQTNRSFGGMLKLVAQDVHVPLYHTILHFWLQLFDNSMTSARALSTILFCLTVLATYKLGSYATNSKRVGLFGAFLVAASPFMHWYGNEARMYGLLALFTASSQYLFLKLIREGPNKNVFLLYTLSTVLGIYSHYFFAFVLLTQGFYFILQKNRITDFGKILRRLICTALIVGLAIAPWLYYAFTMGSAGNTKPNLTVPSSVDLFNTYSQFLFGFQSDALNTILVSLWPLSVLLAFLALQKSKKVSSEILFLVLGATLPVVGAFAVSFIAQPFFLSRYLIVSLPALSIFTSWILSTYPKKVRILLQAGVTILIGITFVIQALNPSAPVKENYQDVSEYLNSQTTSQDTVILSAPFTIYPVEYYYTGKANLTTLPSWDRFSQGAIPGFEEAKLPSEVMRANGVYRKAYLVLSFDQGYQTKIKEYYDNNFERIDAKEFSPGLNIYTYKLRYDPLVAL